MNITGPFPEQAIMSHGIEDARLAKQHDQHDRAQPGQRAGIDDIAAPLDAGFTNRQRHRRSDVQTGIMNRSCEQAGYDDVQEGADDERAENSDGHVFLRLLGFLGGSGYRVESDISEEHHSSTAQDAGPAVGSEGPGVGRNEYLPVLAGGSRMLEHEGERNGDEGQDRRQLDEDNGGIEIGGFLDADDEDDRDDGDGEKGDEIEFRGGMRIRSELFGGKIERCGRAPTAVNHDPESAWHIADLGRQTDSVVLQERDEGAAPTAGDGGRSKSVFEDQVPADDPSDDFAKRRVTVGIRRSGDRDHGGEFRVAQASKYAAKASQNVRQHDGWARIEGGSRSGQHKDASADDSADAESHQVDGAQGALEAVLTGVGGFSHQRVERLGCKQRPAHANP